MALFNLERYKEASDNFTHALYIEPHNEMALEYKKLAEENLQMLHDSKGGRKVVHMHGKVPHQVEGLEKRKGSDE